MTGRDRALRALNCEPVDRPPVAGGLIANPDYLAHLAGVDDFWRAARETTFAACRRLGCDAVLGPVIPSPPAQTTRDAHGRVTSFTRVERQPELNTPEKIAEFAAGPAANAADVDVGKAADEYACMMARGQADAGEMLFIPHCLGKAPRFPTSDCEFRYESFLMACALYTDAMQSLFRRWARAARLRFEAVARATLEQDLLPLIWIGTDLCDARGPVLSPQLLRRLYFPGLAEAIEPLKSAGMKVVWHADANYAAILDDLIALGIDGFQGFFETEDGIQFDDLARRTALSGEPLILFGSISTAFVLPGGTPGDVRRAVHHCRAARPHGRGLLIAPSSSIGPEVPWENIDAMYAAATEP